MPCRCASASGPELRAAAWHAVLTLLAMLVVCRVPYGGPLMLALAALTAGRRADAAASRGEDDASALLRILACATWALTGAVAVCTLLARCAAGPGGEGTGAANLAGLVLGVMAAGMVVVVVATIALAFCPAARKDRW